MTNEERIDILKQKREKLNSISPSFCAAKWLQTTLYLQNGYNHSCHHPSPHKIPLKEIAENPAALHNSKHKKAMRKMMLNGKRPPECQYCWNIEDLDSEFFSDRHYKSADSWAWDQVDKISKLDASEDVYPTYLEISFSNVCNFGCAYCSPEISSKWMEDVTKNGPYGTIHSKHDLDYLKEIGKYPYHYNEDNPYINAFWEWFPDVLPHLKVLRLTGGEPTLSRDVWKMLDFIIENPRDIEIAINTNLGTDDHLIDKLIEKIKALQEKNIKVDIYTSVEAVGKVAEYIRDGMDYERWLNNVKRILNETESTVAIMTTINVLSIFHFNDFIEMVMTLRAEYNNDFAYNRIPISVNILHWPTHLRLLILDHDVRKKLAQSIYSKCESWLKYYSKEKYARIYLEEWDQIKRLCEYLETNDTEYKYRKDFQTFIKEYDKRRNKDFTDLGVTIG